MMMNPINYIKYCCWAVVLASTFLLGACDDNDNDDEVGSVQKVYLSSGVNPFDFQNVYVELNPVNVPDKIEFKIPVRITAPVSSDVTVTLELDDLAVIEAYNAEHKTSYETPVEGTYELTKNTVILKAGEYVSTDYACLTLVNFKEMNMSGKYMFPVRMKEIAGKNVEMSTNLNRMFYAVINKYNNVEPENSDIEGGVFADRTGWKLSASNSPRSVRYLLDNDKSSTWKPQTENDVKVTLKLNFTKAIAIKGIAMTNDPDSWGGDANVKTVRVYISDDWSNDDKWVFQGEREFVNSKMQIDNILKFYAPVTTQYVMLEFPDSWYAEGDFGSKGEIATYIAELNMIQ